MSGVSADSHILSSVSVGPNANPYEQHRVTIVPFHQEIRRDTSAWGQILDFKIITGTTNSSGFAFVTRGQGKSFAFTNSESLNSHITSVCAFTAALDSGFGNPPAPSTPKKKAASDMFSSVTSPRVERPSFTNPQNVCLNYEDYSACLATFSRSCNTYSLMHSSHLRRLSCRWPAFQFYTEGLRQAPLLVVMEQRKACRNS